MARTITPHKPVPVALARRCQWWWQVVDECGNVLADNLPNAMAANELAARMMAPAE